MQVVTPTRRILFSDSYQPERENEPFRRQGMFARLAPFGLVTVLAELSLIFDVGLKSETWAVVSAFLWAATALSFLLPWDRLPPAASLAVPLTCLGSILALNLAFGGLADGANVVLLLPVIWTALYQRPWQSVVVVLAVVVFQLLIVLAAGGGLDAVLVRRLVLWGTIGGLLSFTTHNLRYRIRVMLEQRQSLISEREAALETAIQSLARLEGREQETRRVNELADALHACTSLEEAHGVIQHSVEQLFVGGALNVLDGSRNRLETVLRWGTYSAPEQPFEPVDCWALRRGRVHTSHDARRVCAHLTEEGSAPVMCIPMVAHGDTIGVLAVCFNDESELADVSQREGNEHLGLSVAEHIAMFIANFRLRETLRLQSIRDPLTNLFNRRYMEETFARELSRASRDKDRLSIVQIDLDNFKTYNDTYGHDYGDALLRAFAGLLTSLFRDEDIPCRYGGEEFTLILPKLALDEAEVRAEQLRTCMSDMRVPLDHQSLMVPPPPTLSIGIAEYPMHGETLKILFRAADKALYAAKAGGRDRVVKAPRPDDGAGHSKPHLLVS
jgi:diguanylate cyclase (GGDEF)-like protein